MTTPSTTTQPYPAYKPSGIPWLGNIPAHWEVRRLKHITRLLMGQSPPGDSYNNETIGMPFLQGCAEFGERYPNSVQFCTSPQKISPVGAILLSVRAPVGRLNIANQEYGIGRGLCAILPNEEILQTEFARDQLEILVHGLKLVSTGSTYEAVSIGDVGSQPTLLPPLHEQRAITQYLHHTDHRIQQYIHAKHRLINLLQEQRQAIITQTITQGTHPNTTPLKPSGIPWLGNIPAHWEVRRLRNILTGISERNRPDLPLLSVVRERGVILRDLTNRDENHNFVPDDLTNYKVVRKGQFAMNKMKAWQGSFGVSQHDGIVSPAYFVFSINRVSSDYFHVAIRSKAYVPLFAQASDGVRIGQWDLSPERMREIPFLVPPLSEQRAVVEYLDKTTADIDTAITRTHRQIELLQEYRMRLIADVVTGKIDVRHTPNQPLNTPNSQAHPPR